MEQKVYEIENLCCANCAAKIEAKFNELPEDVQVIFKEAAQEAAEYERAWCAANEAEQLQAMKDNGMQVVENPDLDSFKAAVQVVYDAYPQYADYLAKINATLAE